MVEYDEKPFYTRKNEGACVIADRITPRWGSRLLATTVLASELLNPITGFAAPTSEAATSESNKPGPTGVVYRYTLCKSNTIEGCAAVFVDAEWREAHSSGLFDEWQGFKFTDTTGYDWVLTGTYLDYNLSSVHSKGYEMSAEPLHYKKI